MPSDSASQLIPGDATHGPAPEPQQPPPDLPYSQPTNVRWLIFSLACGTSFILYLHRYTWGAIKSQLDLSTSEMGYLDGVFMFTYAFGQIPGGMLGDWFGTHLVLTAMIFTWSLGMGTLVYARNFWQMTASRLTFGLAQAGCYPNLGKVTKSWFDPEVRTTVQGFVSSFFGRTGGAASYIIFGSLMLGYWKLDWRVAILIFTGIGLAFSVLFGLLFRTSPSQHPWTNAEETELVTSSDPAAAATGRVVLNWGLAARDPNMLAMVIQQFCAAYADNVFSAWIFIYLAQEKKVSLLNAGWMSALPLMGGAVGGVLGGMLQNSLIRTIGRRWARALVGLMGSGTAAILMLLSTQFDSAQSVIITLMVLKFFADWAQPTMWATCTDIGGRSAASVFAIINTSGSIAGIVAGPVMGWIIQWFSTTPVVPGKHAVPDGNGWNALFFSLAAIYLASAVSWLFIDCTKPIELEDAPASMNGASS